LSKGQEVSTGSLLSEIDKLTAVKIFPSIPYKTIQFSSFDRRSTLPSKKDGSEIQMDLGGKPLPGFEMVLNRTRNG
jgi:hypothetical protein